MSKKFRPVLSEHQISHILSLARRDGSNESLDIIRALGMYEYKIKNEIISPAYSIAPVVELSVQLGFSESTANNPVVSDEILYGIWMQEPESLNVEQLKRVRTYRYENNKMTMDEEKLFEKEVLGMAI